MNSRTQIFRGELRGQFLQKPQARLRIIPGAPVQTTMVICEVPFHMAFKENNSMIPKKFAALHCAKIFLLLVSFSNFIFPQPNMLKTGYAYSPRCTTYVHEKGHEESPQRVKWINNRLAETNVLQQVSLIGPLADPMPHILRVHTDSHIQSIHAIPRDSTASAKIGPIADLAAALTLGAVDAVCAGRVKNAFCNIRPPGHHARSDGYIIGFCAYANIVIAARFAQEVMNHRRILIIDWDFHPGDGTIELVCKDTNILFFEVGSDFRGGPDCNEQRLHIIAKDLEGDGDNEEYISVWKELLLPAAEEFKPELVLISCGFDIKKNDFQGSYNVTAQGISRLTKMAMDIAEKHCQGKLVSVLEGGYHDTNTLSDTWHGLSQCAENHVKTLMTGIVQPETPYFLLSGIRKVEAFKLGPAAQWALLPWPARFPPDARLFDIRGKMKMLGPGTQNALYLIQNSE